MVRVNHLVDAKATCLAQLTVFRNSVLVTSTSTHLVFSYFPIVIYAHSVRMSCLPIITNLQSITRKQKNNVSLIKSSNVYLHRTQIDNDSNITCQTYG